MTLIKELKQTSHCCIVVIFFWSLSLSFPDMRSSKVTSGAPNRLGSSSWSSMNSPFHIFLASFSGIGGECAPTEAAPLERGLAGGGSKLDRGVLGVSVSPLLEGPGMADKLDMMLLAALSCVAPDVAIDAIGMLCSAADCGMEPAPRLVSL